MSDTPFIDPDFATVRNGLDAFEPEKKLDPIPQPLPDLVEEPDTEERQIAENIPPEADPVSAESKPVEEPAEPGDGEPDTDPAMQTLRDPETFLRNREKFEHGDIPSSSDDIFLIKVNGEVVRDALIELETRIGTETFLEEVLRPGSATNLLYRYALDTYNDSYRVQELFEKMTPEVRETLLNRFKDPFNPKAEFKWFVSTEVPKDGSESLSGNAAYERMTAMDEGARGRFLLYESNIGLEMITPQNRDWDTLFNLLGQDEIAQYTDIGLEVYDLTSYRLREITLDWLRQFITRCTLFNWQKPNILEKALTLQDFNVLLVDLAQLSYPGGFDRFVDRCFRPASKDAPGWSEQWPTGCSHEHRITIKPADLVITRFALMTEDQFKEMAKRRSLKSCTLAQVEEYRKGFEFSNLVIEQRDWTLTLSMPTLDRYFAVSRAAFAASESVIRGGNTPSVLQDMANKGYRNLSCYISAITRTRAAGSYTTDDPEAIMKILGTICDEDERMCDPDKIDDWVLSKITKFTEGCQLTYIGYQSKPCPECGWVNPSTDGWSAVDPLRTFFTIGRSRL